MKIYEFRTFAQIVVASMACAFALPSQAAIVVTPVDITDPGGATLLVNTILGSGINLISVAPGVGSATSAGTFTGGVSSGLGFDSGIVLTSGSAALIDGTNSSDSSTGSASGVGDADLNTLAAGPTTDTTSLQFTFDFDGGGGGDVFFRFIFASEEYNEFTNSSFNDVFGFFLDGVNIALIPGTSTPVAINTVNGGNPLGVSASHPEFFNNNDPSDGGAFPFEYDGFTHVFTAEAIGLAAGTHTIKLAISDVSDTSLDSGVFIQAGTFSTVPLPPNGEVPEPSQVIVWLGLAATAASAKFLASRRPIAADEA